MAKLRPPQEPRVQLGLPGTGVPGEVVAGRTEARRQRVLLKRWGWLPVPVRRAVVELSALGKVWCCSVRVSTPAMGGVAVRGLGDCERNPRYKTPAPLPERFFEKLAAVAAQGGLKKLPGAIGTLGYTWAPLKGAREVTK